MKIIDLNGSWKLYRAGDTTPIAAVVPGSVFHDLMENGLMEDPFYRDNEKTARELSYHNYTYERTFEVPEEYLGAKRVELCCEGLDTLTKIYINGELVGETDNMFRRYELDVKSVLKAGDNFIRIEFASVSRFAQEMADKKELFQFDYAMPGMGHIRKGHYMFGWDWGPQIPDMGIYRSISLKAYEKGKITDVLFSQKHSEGKVRLSASISAQLFEEGVSYELRITNPDSLTETYISNTGSFTIDIENPQLWWPHGYGEQKLYQVEAVLVKNGLEADKKYYRLGLRTMELIQEEDEWGRSCYFRVNEVPIYLKGADYIPEDNILPRCSYERTRRLLLDCIECNHNAVRVWGGGIYPEEYFYDLCDELGIVVWQDLMFACATYDSDNETFMDTTLKEITFQIGRIRHRACLGLICGNNEMELAHVEWDMKDLEENKKRYLHMFENLLPKLAAETAPDVAYWLASPTSGGNFFEPNNENYGDMHYWGVWHECAPFEAYRSINPRFMSEFGIQSFPCLKTMKSCTEPEDRNIFSRVMELHQKGGPEGNERILNYVSQLYRYPRNFESLLYISQMIQAEGIRYGVEHWRRIFGRCMGVIYWQLNDCWPVASWSGIDSCGRWKALHYFSKKFFSPLLVSADNVGKKMEIYITNDLNREAKLELDWTLYRFDGTKVRSDSMQAVVGGCQAKRVLGLDFEKDIRTQEEAENTLVLLELKQEGELVSENMVYFAPVKYMTLKTPHIDVNIRECEDGFELSFQVDTLVKSLFVDFKDYDFVLSDNFFDLIPGKGKTIFLSKERAAGMDCKMLKEQIRWMSIADTYDEI